jgi:hypothetical protein
MPARDNYTYYRQRATTEREHARSAKDPSAAYLHEQLAGAYEALVAEIRSRPHLKLVEPSIIHGGIPLPDGSDRNASATR